MSSLRSDCSARSLASWLAVAGLTSQNDQMVRAAYLAMELIARFVILTLALASLLTGLI